MFMYLLTSHLCLIIVLFLNAAPQTRKGNWDNSDILFLLLNKHICCNFSLESSRQEGLMRDHSMFLWENKDNYLQNICFPFLTGALI